MSDKKHTPEPFGYFKAEPFGWTDCAETDDGAVPLYKKQDIETLMKQLDHLNRLCEFNERTMAELEKQRDELLAALERIRKQQETIGATGNSAWTTADFAIASAKGGA
ncbi:MAG: hypothetical protein PHD19_09545 [Dechloromonas sp.]|nr:hypothetical protein [Dechloromonas sp.]